MQSNFESTDIEASLINCINKQNAVAIKETFGNQKLNLTNEKKALKAKSDALADMKDILEITNEGKNLLDTFKYSLLVICGVSGCGKSTFEKKLNETPYFNKLPQVTTRKKREGEIHDQSCYYFIDEVLYDKFQLIAKTTFNGNKYGTIPVFDENSVNTVVASAEAINELACNARYLSLPASLYLVMLDIDTEDLPEESRREGRDDDFINNERTLLQTAILANKDIFKQIIYYKISKDENGNLLYPEFDDIIEI